ncbi:MAG: hypothetical protein JWR64_2795, partial [Marmoricola sp.]|nr:hypothetical protein [Marmoricola sp.]
YDENGTRGEESASADLDGSEGGSGASEQPGD